MVNVWSEQTATDENFWCEGIVCRWWLKVKMTFSVKQRLFTIEVYHATKLYAKVKEEFKNEYPESGNIPKSPIKCLIDKFKKTVLIHDALGKAWQKLRHSLVRWRGVTHHEFPWNRYLNASANVGTQGKLTHFLQEMISQRPVVLSQISCSRGLPEWGNENIRPL